MEYCPFCSEPVKSGAKTCPNCRKTIDFDELAGLYRPGESSHIDQTAKRRIWIREHALLIYPFIAVLIGLVAGAAVMFTWQEVSIANRINEFETRIGTLQDSISTSKQLADSVQNELQQQLTRKDSIISILDQQKSTMARIITSTRRLARNSTITPNTPDQADYFRRNINYLIRVYNNQQQALKETGHEKLPEFNLKTVPQLLESSP